MCVWGGGGGGWGEGGFQNYKGFKVILENGTEEVSPTWKRFNGFRSVDEDAVQKEGGKVMMD